MRLFALALAAAGLAACNTAPDSTADSAPDRPTVEHMNAEAVFPSGLPFSEAVRVGDTVYLAGMVGVAPGTLDIVPGGTGAEARQTLDNIAAILDANGLGLEDVVKCVVMLEDIAEWGAFNEVYQTYFSAPYPARSAFGADGLALGARVEVECIAAMPE